MCRQGSSLDAFLSDCIDCIKTWRTQNRCRYLLVSVAAHLTSELLKIMRAC